MPDAPRGALSRQDGMKALDQAAAQAVTQGQSLAVLVLDLDHFKIYQDGAGPAAAQAVLDQLTGILGASLPADASLTHLSGDAYFVALLGADIAAAQGLAEQLREAVATGLAGVVAQPPLTVTIGVATSPADKSWTGSALLSLADARMTFAKRRLMSHHNLVWAGSLPSDWYARLDIDPTRWPVLEDASPVT